MPAPLVAYWTAWNQVDLSAIPALVERAVTVDVEWNDPRDSLVGRPALESLILELRRTRPRYRFVLASEIDHHNGRYRYRWDMTSRERTLMQGLDIVTIDPESELIGRVDGFFGPPTPVKTSGSGIPATLRPVS